MAKKKATARRTTPAKSQPVIQVSKRWFISYVKVLRASRAVSFGSNVLERDEHPVELINRWNREIGNKDGWDVSLIGFQEVARDVPEMDLMTNYIT